MPIRLQRRVGRWHGAERGTDALQGDRPLAASRRPAGSSSRRTHVAAVLQKLGLRDRVQAVVLADETGLVPPGGT